MSIPLDLIPSHTSSWLDVALNVIRVPKAQMTLAGGKTTSVGAPTGSHRPASPRPGRGA